MLSEKLQHKMYIMRILSDSHASAILLELLNARDAGKSSVPHKELLWLVDVSITAKTLYWQNGLRELERLGIIELVPHDDHTVSYRLDPGMDEFCAELIKLLFTGEKGSREKLPPPPNPNSEYLKQTNNPPPSH